MWKAIILIVAPDYDPVVTANTVIIRKLCRLLSERFPVTVVTMTPEASGDQEADGENGGSLTVIRMPFAHTLRGSGFSLETVRLLCLKSREAMLENTVNERAAHYFLSDLEKVIDVRAIEAIVSFSAPFTAHLCAGRLAKQYGIPWIAYYFDPFFSNQTLDPGKMRLRKKLEEKTLADAACVMMTYPTDEDYRRRDAEFREKIIGTEMPGIDWNRHMSVRPEGRLPLQCFFFGSLYRDIRNPEPVIRVFSEIADMVHLTFVGSHFGINPEDYQKDATFVSFLGRQTGEKLQALYENADILLNIGNTVENQMPSKIFEYISTGKPILNVYQISNCPTLKYLRDYPLALNIPMDLLMTAPSEQAGKIADFCKKSIKQEVSREDLEARYYKNTFECAAEQIAEKIVFYLTE